MKKVALGTALAMMLALVPALFVGTASAVVGSSTVRVINGQAGPAGGAIDVYFDGIKLVDDLGLGQGVDITVPADNPDVTACSANSTGIDGFGVCQPVAGPTPALNIGTPLFPIAIGDGGNYTLVILGAIGPDPINFTNDLGPTGLNEARYTVHNASVFLFARCLHQRCEGRDRPRSPVTLRRFPSRLSRVPTTQSSSRVPRAARLHKGNVNFVAGTNFVQTIVIASQPVLHHWLRAGAVRG